MRKYSRPSGCSLTVILIGLAYWAGQGQPTVRCSPSDHEKFHRAGRQLTAADLPLTSCSRPGSGRLPW
jgi:hypothetical protein